MSEQTQPDCCVFDVAMLRSAQLDDDEIQASVLMRDRGRCPTHGTDEDLAEYQRLVLSIRGSR